MLYDRSPAARIRENAWRARNDTLGHLTTAELREEVRRLREQLDHLRTRLERATSSAERAPST